MLEDLSYFQGILKAFYDLGRTQREGKSRESVGTAGAERTQLDEG